MPLHFGVAFATVGHTVVQEPQWAGSVSSFTQKPLHSENVASHANVQAPLVQVGPALRTAVAQDWYGAGHRRTRPPCSPAGKLPDAQQPVPHEVPHPPQWF